MVCRPLLSSLKKNNLKENYYFLFNASTNKLKFHRNRNGF